MAPPASKKQRKNTGKAAATTASSSNAPRPDPLAAATNEERASWPGFVEVECDPAHWTTMLRRLGVSGIQLRDLVGLDDWSLAMLPQPIYGLVYLYHYRDDDDAPQVTKCPPNVWFGRQLFANSCASVALINIVNNLPSGIELGDKVQAFKEHTADMTPLARGKEIGKFDHLRQVHNSFARKMDILVSDLDNERAVLAQRRCKARNPNPKPKPKKAASRKRKAPATADDYDDSVLHFVAYLPVGGQVWKLDGMDAQPRLLGAYEDDQWLGVVVPALQQRLAEGGEETSLMAVCPDDGADVVRRVADEAKFNERCFDYGPLVRAWLGVLARKEGVLAELVEETLSRSQSESAKE